MTEHASSMDGASTTDINQRTSGWFYNYAVKEPT